jgi:hypothetical protein
MLGGALLVFEYGFRSHLMNACYILLQFNFDTTAITNQQAWIEVHALPHQMLLTRLMRCRAC